MVPSIGSVQALLSFFFSKTLLFVILGSLGIGFLIGFHELGHFLMCKLLKIDTLSFSIGMGPRLISKKWWKTQFSFSALPLGGYVEINPKSFDTHPYWHKLLVMLGGIGFNLIFSYVVFIALHITGMPDSMLPIAQSSKPIIAAIIPESPAEIAGLRPKDIILKINGSSVDGNVETIITKVSENANQAIDLTIKRKRKERTVSVKLGEQVVGRSVFGYLGVQFEKAVRKSVSIWQSVVDGVAYTNRLIYRIALAFKSMITTKNISGLGGPIMVVSQTVHHASKGMKIFLALLALISINLAVLNLIPVPIMDGGQILLHTIEALLRKKLPLKIKEGIFLITWILFFGLALFLSLRDVANLYQENRAQSTEHPIHKKGHM
ncbi:site-2 protease family protein [Candidatus Babeliales bacterium]|nr:site-2 protease family protein [Candidatus Babeliales bacterium]